MIETLMMFALCLIAIGVIGTALNVLAWIIRPIVNWLGKTERWF